MSDDLISRQAAIDALLEAYPDNMDVEFILGKLPSAQPDLDEVCAHAETEAEARYHAERKKGKWIDRGWSGDGRGNSWHEWECSECKHITKGAKWNFCPNCGADMREDGKADA